MTPSAGEGGIVRHGSHFLGAMVLGLLAVLAVDGVVGWSVWEDRRHHLESAMELVDGRAATYERFARHLVAGLDQLLLVMGDRLHAGEDPERLGGLVNDLIDRSPVVEWAALIDRRGERRFSGASASAPGDLPLAGACRPGQARLSVVATPPRDRGPRFLSLCRTYSDAATAVHMGIAIARLAEYFAESRDAAAGELTVSLADGTILFSLAPGGGGVSVTGGPRDADRSGDWLTAERRVAGYPLVVAARFPMDRALSEWRARTWTWAIAALLFNGGFATLMAVLWRQARKGVEASRRLVASELQAGAVFDQAFQMIVLLEPDGRVRRVNDTAAAVLNLRPEQAVGRPLWDGNWGGSDPDIRESEGRQLRAAVEAAAHGGIVRYEARPASVETGEQRIFDVVVKPVRDPEGAIVEVMVEGRDVSEAIRTRETLLRTERMAALGGLVAGIAHEINTPIGVATTSASYLAREVRELRHKVDARKLTASAMEEFLGSAAEAAELTLGNCGRAAQLIQSFKQVAVDQVGGERRRFRLAGYIDEILVSLRPRLKREPHVVEVECPPDLELETDAGALSHGLTNLIVNALVHAFPDGRVGTIRIAARALDDDRVKLVFSDDGVGIPKAMQERVFDPFFTTKRGAGGSGLGLHILHRAVTGSLGGTLRLASDEGKGTAFVMTFPRTAPGEGRGSGKMTGERGMDDGHV